eukprot:122171-Pelagomonas_calceolata.AAC.5
MYFTFVVEQRHGFNKQTPRLFLWDALQSVSDRLAIKERGNNGAESRTKQMEGLHITKPVQPTVNASKCQPKGKPTPKPRDSSMALHQEVKPQDCKNKGTVVFKERREAAQEVGTGWWKELFAGLHAWRMTKDCTFDVQPMPIAAD